MNAARAIALSLVFSVATPLQAQTPPAADTPQAVGQLGLTESSTGRWIDAEHHLSVALQSAADPYVVRNRAALDQALVIARSHLGFLIVACETPGAEVWVDNRLSGAATEAQTHRVLSGTVSFEVRADGYATTFHTATVPPNGRARASVDALVANAVAPAVTPHVVSAPAVVDAPARSSSLGTVGTVGIVAGAALAVGGVVAWVLGSASVSDFNDDPRCPRINAPVQPTECQQRIDTARTLEPIAWAGIGVGGALAVGGLALVLAAPSRTPAHARAFRCGQGPGTVGLACTLAF